MARFKYTDNSQGQFMTVNLAEQLLPGTFEWTLDYLIDKMDLSSFEQNYNNDETGAAAYPPKVLLKQIFYCYSAGILSSREIEKTCRRHIIVKALAEGCEPDHSTIAAFISGNGNAVNDLFVEVLLQCAELKLITGEMFAFDGCKLPSDASKEWSGTIEDLKQKRDKLKEYIGRLVARHQELDKDAKAQKILKPFKQTMGNDRERRARSIERLEQRLEKLNVFLKDAKPRIGLSGEEVQSNITDNQSALIKSPHGYIQGYNGIAVADSGSQIIVCAEVTGNVSESGRFPEMLDQLEENMRTITGKKKPLKGSLVEGDTGFFSEDNLQEAKKRGIEVLIPDPQFRQRDPYFAEKKEQKVPKQKRFTVEDFTYDKRKDRYICPAGKTLEYKCEVKLRNNSGKQYRAKRTDCANCPLLKKCINAKKSEKPFGTLYIVEKKYEENLSGKMREKIDKPAYRELYSRRMQTIEPTFSHITYCKGMNRFLLRGEDKVGIQWKLYCMVHNMWKCMKALGEQYGT
jgi:transposase